MHLFISRNILMDVVIPGIHSEMIFILVRLPPNFFDNFYASQCGKNCRSAE